MQAAVSAAGAAARRRFFGRLSRIVIDSVSPAGAEFARNPADSDASGMTTA
jgi:hypothetical protein